jgi:hypothetical protein
MKIKRHFQLIEHKEFLTTLEKVDENTIKINGETHYFPPGFDVYDIEPEPGHTPEIAMARRIDGELHLDVLYQYSAGKIPENRYGPEANYEDL